MLRGPATTNFWTDDLDAAKRWYTELLGIAPYFERPGPDGAPAYCEFRVGDHEHELGLVHRRFAPDGEASGVGGAILYWHVDDLDGTLAKLLSMGAKEHQPRIARGDRFVTASVVDPFGNILGIMTNPHYLATLSVSR
ncbi:VOC family protein [Actinomadura fibrosa]|uniref:VOC family protein n=1 Tax=Actinomadura fibrosa TaxID=111802 RepID=A0ABW2XUH6_9ACTN|nr:VOC family protein [Actinomadura fibrosa]